MINKKTSILPEEIEITNKENKIKNIRHKFNTGDWVYTYRLSD